MNLPSSSNLHLQTSSSCRPVNPSKSSINTINISFSQTNRERRQEKHQTPSDIEPTLKSPTYASFWFDKEKRRGYLNRKATSPLQDTSQKLVFAPFPTLLVISELNQFESSKT